MAGFLAAFEPFVVCSHQLVLKNDSRHFSCFCQSRLIFFMPKY